MPIVVVVLANGTVEKATVDLDDSHDDAAVDTAYFVVPWGWDANEGSFAKPWRTLQHAVDVAPKGAGVFLMNGTFDGATIDRSGLTIAAADGMWPVISGGTNTVFFDGVAGGTLRNVTVAGGDGYRRTGILVGSSDGVSIAPADAWTTVQIGRAHV